MNMCSTLIRQSGSFKTHLYLCRDSAVRSSVRSVLIWSTEIDSGKVGEVGIILDFKGIVHLKVKSLSSFVHLHVVSNLQEDCSGCLFAMKSVWVASLKNDKIYCCKFHWQNPVISVGDQ